MFYIYSPEISGNDDLLIKLKYVHDTVSGMLIREFEKRPNCSEILSKSKLWSITYNEVQAFGITEEELMRKLIIRSIFINQIPMETWKFFQRYCFARLENLKMKTTPLLILTLRSHLI